MAEVTKFRANLFRYDPEFNIIGTLRKTKPSGYRKLWVRIHCLPLDVIAAGHVIEMDVVIGGTTIGGPSTKKFFRQARLIREGDSDANFVMLNYDFTGWDPAEMIYDLYLVRRNDTSLHGTPSPVGLAVDRVSVISY